MEALVRSSEKQRQGRLLGGGLRLGEAAPGLLVKLRPAEPRARLLSGAALPQGGRDTEEVPRRPGT